MDSQVARPTLDGKYKSVCAAISSWIERHPYGVLLVFSLFYFSTTCVIAAQKAFWFDEVFTVRICSAPEISSESFNHFSEAEINPPLNFLLTRACFVLFGVGHVTARLPAICGFWVLCCTLFFVTRRWCPAPYPVLAMLLPFATIAHHTYAVEARPYGLLLGFAAAAFACWQCLVLGEKRVLAAIGLAMSLGGAVATHYYAVLLFIPFGFGELTRLAIDRRIDWLAWCAIICGLLPLGPIYPIMEHSRQTYLGLGYAATWSRSIVDFFRVLLEQDLLLFVAAVAVAAFFPTKLLGNGHHKEPPPVPLVVAILGMLALPVMGTALAIFVTNSYMPRYVLPAVTALTLIITYAAARHTNGTPSFGVTLVVLLVAWLSVVVIFNYKARKNDFAFFLSSQRTLEKGIQEYGEIVVANPLLFLQQAHYMPADKGCRLVYTLNPREHALAALKHFWPELNVQSREEFLSTNKEFTIYEGDDTSLSGALVEQERVVTKKPNGYVHVRNSALK